MQEQQTRQARPQAEPILALIHKTLMMIRSGTAQRLSRLAALSALLIVTRRSPPQGCPAQTLYWKPPYTQPAERARLPLDRRGMPIT